MMVSMNHLTLYRKRLIPPETVLLKDDLILRADDDVIVTQWQAFHPRPDLMHGASCYYIKENIKLSKMIHDDHSFHWYFDIADYTWNETRDTLTMTDLLADVVVDLRGCIRVLDLDELADAHTQGLLSGELLKKSLYTLNRLLQELYTHGVERLAAPLANIPQ